MASRDRSFECVCEAWNVSECACGALWAEEAAERRERDLYHHQGGCEDVLDWLRRPVTFSDIAYEAQWSAMSWCLASNLAIGAGPCKAWAHGFDEAEQHGLYHAYGYRKDKCWWPGCGREAP